MKTYVLKGSKQEIVEGLAHIHGEVREAIIFVEEPASAAPERNTFATDDIFAEMRPFMVDASDLDDSREAIYNGMNRE